MSNALRFLGKKYIYITKFRILLLEIITSFLLKWVGTYIYKSYLLFLAFT